MQRLFLVALAGLALVAAESLYDASKSPVLLVNSGNWNMQIKKQFPDHVKLVEFYAPWCGHCKAFAPEYEKLATELKGLVKVHAVNCETDEKLCKDNGVSGFPTIKLFAPGGILTQEYSGERDVKSLVKFATGFMNNFVTKVTGEKEAAFVNSNPQQAKALLFTDKAKTPLIFKGLSVDFKDKVALGLVKSEDKALCSKYRVTKFPSLLVLLHGEKKPIRYDGKMDYQSIFHFLNRYQETFALNEVDDDPLADKPWMKESVPELHIHSADDVCFKFEGLCVVTFAKGEGDALPKALADANLAMKAKFERQIQRGAKFNFVWVNVDKEKEFVDAFKFESFPQIAVLKLGKRNRFAAGEGDLSEGTMSTFLDKVIGGDARYTPLNPMPKLAPREGVLPEKKPKKK